MSKYLKKETKLFKINFFCLFLVIFSFIFFVKFSFAQKSSLDAVAIRVIPNPDHYSALSWYKKQNFKGSPQSITVDGYEAIRDGRTVYVDVANISGGTLYTNIYLISYNQEAEDVTVDIFSQILSHWKFNSNISAMGYCRNKPEKKCLDDDECSLGDYCSSNKARVVRDVRRLADLTDLNLILESYRMSHNGGYPILSAGTYLPNKTMSVWPSWKDTLSKQLSVNLPVDPINKLDGGECLGYNEVTCWSEVLKRFYTDLPVFPDNSLTYYYTVDSLGKNASFCASFESDYPISYPPPYCMDVCLDFDDDGFGSPGSGFCSGGLVTDCNDNDPTVNASLSSENTAAACGNAVDDDCDGLVDCDDLDCVGVGGCAILASCNFNCVCEAAKGETALSCTDCSYVNNDSICFASCECFGCSSYSFTDCGCGNGSLNVGEECDDGNTNNGDGCSSFCKFEVSACTDSDGDRYISEGTNISSCGNVCGPSSNMSCFGNNDCDDSNASRYPGNVEQCDSIDHDCDGNAVNGFTLDTCLWMCDNNGYTWTGNGGSLNCCGNDAGEGPYAVSEDISTTCNDSRDNDCDGFCDLVNDACYPGSLPDSDCTGSCSNSSEKNWAVAGESDCNQCDFNGDNDGDQEDVGGPFWLTTYPGEPGLADMCDTDCISDGATVSPFSPSVHINDFEKGTESTCNDGIDNDCDGNIDCNDADCSGNPSCCVDDCSPGDTGCSGENNVWTCGEAGDGDTCLDVVISPCSPSYKCNSATFVCELSCTDDDGDTFSPDGGVCGDLDCDDSLDFVYPGGTETCDTHDNDCDGSTDEGCNDDGDGYCNKNMQLYGGNSMCLNTFFSGDGMWGDDCDDSKPLVSPGVPSEIPGSTCSDSMDNDCDTLSDCADPDCATDASCATTEYCDFPFTFPCEF